MVNLNLSQIICGIVGGVTVGLATNLFLYLFIRVPSFNELISQKQLKESTTLILQFFFFMGFVTIPYLIAELEKGVITLWNIELILFDSGVFIYSSLNWIGWLLGGLLLGFGTRMIGVTYNATILIPLMEKASSLFLVITGSVAIEVSTLTTHYITMFFVIVLILGLIFLLVKFPEAK